MMFSSVFSLSFSIIFPRNEKWWTMVKFKAIENTSLFFLHLRIFHTLSMLFFPLSSQPSTNHTERKLDGMCFFWSFLFSLPFAQFCLSKMTIGNNSRNKIQFGRFVSFRFFSFFLSSFCYFFFSDCFVIQTVKSIGVAPLVRGMN